MTWNDTSCPQHTRVTQPREIELTRRRKNSIYSYKRRLKPLPRVKENKRNRSVVSIHPWTHKEGPNGARATTKGTISSKYSVRHHHHHPSGWNEARNVVHRLLPMEVPKGKPSIDRIESSGPPWRQGSLNPRECVSEGFDRKWPMTCRVGTILWGDRSSRAIPSIHPSIHPLSHMWLATWVGALGIVCRHQLQWE